MVGILKMAIESYSIGVDILLVTLVDHSRRKGTFCCFVNVYACIYIIYTILSFFCDACEQMIQIYKSICYHVLGLLCISQIDILQHEDMMNIFYVLTLLFLSIFSVYRGPQGGAFDKDLNYFRTTLGSKTLIPGLECALRQMKPGGIRQVIIPYGPLSYPPEDKEHELVGPKPTTFSGMRALNFVLDNPRVDRTLLFNVKLIRVDRGDGKGGFIRG